MTTYSKPIFNIPVSFSSSPIVYVYKTVSFTSPSNLTSNGTLGGDSFAVSRYYWSNGEYLFVDDLPENANDEHPAWKAFDSSSSTFNYIWANEDHHGYMIIYNPDPINIESITITMRSSTYGIRSFYLQGSNDGINYTNIEYFNAGNTSPSTWNITVSPYNGYYKYYRWEVDRGSRDSSSYTSVQMSNIVITGTKKVANKRLYLYNNGNECLSVTGGWVIDENSASDGTYPYKGEDGLYLQYSHMGWPGSCFITNNIIPILSYSKIGCVFRIYKTYSRYQCIRFVNTNQIDYSSGYSNRPVFPTYSYLATESSPYDDVGLAYGTVNQWSEDIVLYASAEHEWRWTTNTKIAINFWGGDSGSGYLHVKQLWLE